MKFKFKKFMAAAAVGLAASLSVLSFNSNVFAETKTFIDLARECSSKIDVNDVKSLEEASKKLNAAVKAANNGFATLAKESPEEAKKAVENFSAGFKEKSSIFSTLSRENFDKYKHDEDVMLNKFFDFNEEKKNVELFKPLVVYDFRDDSKDKDALQKVLDCASKNNLGFKVLNKATNEVVFENDATAEIEEEKVDKKKGEKPGFKDLAILADWSYMLSGTIKEDSDLEIDVVDKSNGEVLLKKELNNNVEFKRSESAEAARA